MKLNRKSQAYQMIKNRILSFQLLPGVKISDEGVAKELGISRTPVREALSMLSEAGLVESRINCGFTVKKFREKEVEDIYMVRECLERLIVRLTIANWDNAKEKEFRALLARYPKIMKIGKLAEYSRADDYFHDLIAKYSGNQTALLSLEKLRDQIIIIRRYDHLRTTSFNETYEEHCEILDFMAKGETKKAEEHMSIHILSSMKVVMELIKN